MNDQGKRPILAKGEEYIIPKELPGSYPPIDKRPSFEEAKQKLSEDMCKVIRDVSMVSNEYLLDEVVVNLRMNIDYSAKSYHPNDFISSINAEDIGSRKWTQKLIDKKGKERTKIGKEVFIKIKKNSLEDLQQRIAAGTGFSKSSIENIRSIDDIYFDPHKDIINKFPADWEHGRAEFVLHPFSSNVEESINRFFRILDDNNVNLSKIRYKTYSTGVTFFSVLLDRNALDKIINYNPLRTARPLNIKGLPTIRSGSGDLQMPQPPTKKTKSTVKIGIFDGGVDKSSPYLDGFITEHNPIKTSKVDGYLSHGTGVAGAVLYGELSSYSAADTLPIPNVNVESFRVLPTTDPTDIDLYEVIDIIEEVVPKNPDIKVYNLSLGPDGAIEDDDISRFTYAIDELSKDGQRIFVVAVGNDEDLPDDRLCRIQSPSDAVNCIGVGSYVPSKSGKLERASYSSYGDGREGCKIKPDFLEFGGDANRPFQLVPFIGDLKNLSAGTSFASPLVTAKVGELIGRSNSINPLLARALMVHSACHPGRKADKYMGHGIVAPSIDEILFCNNPKILTMYTHKVRPKQAINIPIPFLNGLPYKGKVVIEYTIAVSTETKSKDSEDYTLSCVEDTFYPNVDKYTVSKKIGDKNKNKTVDSNNREEIEMLIKDGWKLRETPNTYSAFSNKYKTEQERKDNFKWDTIIKRRASLKYSSLKEPYIVLHAMERGNSKINFVNFAAVISISYEKSTADIYGQTLDIYNKLQPISVRSINEILIKM